MSNNAILKRLTFLREFKKPSLIALASFFLLYFIFGSVTPFRIDDFAWALNYQTNYDEAGRLFANFIEFAFVSLRINFVAASLIAILWTSMIVSFCFIFRRFDANFILFTNSLIFLISYQIWNQSFGWYATFAVYVVPWATFLPVVAKVFEPDSSCKTRGIKDYCLYAFLTFISMLCLENFSTTAVIFAFAILIFFRKNKLRSRFNIVIFSAAVVGFVTMLLNNQRIAGDVNGYKRTHFSSAHDVFEHIGWLNRYFFMQVLRLNFPLLIIMILLVLLIVAMRVFAPQLFDKSQFSKNLRIFVALLLLSYCSVLPLIEFNGAGYIGIDRVFFPSIMIIILGIFHLYCSACQTLSALSKKFTSANAACTLLIFILSIIHIAPVYFDYYTYNSVRDEETAKVKSGQSTELLLREPKMAKYWIYGGKDALDNSFRIRTFFEFYNLPLSTTLSYDDGSTYHL